VNTPTEAEEAVRQEKSRKAKELWLRGLRERYGVEVRWDRVERHLHSRGWS
jgi:hypothetical protein